MIKKSGITRRCKKTNKCPHHKSVNIVNIQTVAKCTSLVKDRISGRMRPCQNSSNCPHHVQLILLPKLIGRCTSTVVDKMNGHIRPCKNTNRCHHHVQTA